MTDELEERLRRALHTPAPPADAHRVLAGVRAGARRRRARTAAVLAGACVLAAAGIGTSVALQSSGRDSRSTVATGPSHAPKTSSPHVPRPTSTAGPQPLTAHAALGTTGVAGTPSGQAWRVSADSCGGTLCARVSRDTGRGWTTLKIIRFRGSGEARRSDVAPVESVQVTADGTDAWVFGRQLWSTHDGGRTWARQEPARTPVSNVDLAAEGGSVFALQPAPLRLWRSDVGHDSWRPVRLPGGYRFGEGVTALAGTVAVVTYSTANQDRVLLTSHDAGATWHEAALPCTGEYGPLQTTSGAMFLHCSDGSGPGMNVWRSRDGDHWSLLTHLATTTYVDDVVPVDDRTVLVVTGEGGLLATAGSEHEVRLRLRKAETVLLGRFLNARDGYLVLAPQGLLRTTDGGRTWSEAG